MRRGLGGILTGDIIVAIDGRPVKRANDLANALDDAKVGDRATLRIVRSERTVGAALLSWYPKRACNLSCAFVSKVLVKGLPLFMSDVHCGLNT